MTRSILLSCLALGCPAALAAANATVELSNHQSGISLALSGANGTDWAVEQTYADATVADLVLFVRSGVAFSLAHNENNTLVNSNTDKRLLGPGPDTGVIHYKLDHDQAAHPYTGTTPTWAPVYTAPFSFATLTYDGTQKVLGTIGDNGGKWGISPRNNTTRWYHGVRDAAGNEWHVLTYWDDDVAYLTKEKIAVHRQGASDGHCVAVCVDPKTPVLQFRSSGTGQFYTTPVKTYQVPRIWAQTTYLTAGVELNLVNLTDAQPVLYRLGDAPFQTYDGTPVEAAKLFQDKAGTAVLEAKCGEQGPVCRRTLVFQPPVPAATEQHGFMLWTDAKDRERVIAKILGTAPFKQGYAYINETIRKAPAPVFTDARGGWRSGADNASSALELAFLITIDGLEKRLDLARRAKTRLLRLARLQPVGSEVDINSHSPGKDYLNELGQTLQLYADAGVAYDLLADSFRSGVHPEGMTPIEELFIRDGLAEIASTILGRMHESYSADIGGGDTHWSHAYEFAVGTIALAMPSYKTPYYGVSGGDRSTVNDLKGEDGCYWNPYPDQAATWYQVATDPLIPTPGFPNVRYPFRAEFLLSDDGWWTGPNDMVGDGDRYHGRQLVDVKHGGLANANCRVELAEMSGYESAFPLRFGAFDAMRRIKGDISSPLSSTTYIRRRLVHGVTPLRWDGPTGIYTAQESSVASALTACNRHYDFASLPAVRERVAALFANKDKQGQHLFDNAYVLALCDDPAALPPAKPQLPALAPILKPLLKHVVKAGTPIQKDIIAIDLNGAPLTITLQGLPNGASYDEAKRRLTWTPQAGDAGVHLVTVTASNGTLSTTRPFPMIVSNDDKPKPIAAPQGFHARVATTGDAIDLTWTAPAAVGDVHAFFLYRDGVFFAALPSGTTSWQDREFAAPRSHTRYHISCVSTWGQESPASEAAEGYVSIPAR